MGNAVATNGRGMERDIVRAAFPSYNGRRIEIKAVTEVHFHPTYWDEGTRHSYGGVNLSTLQGVRLPNQNPPQFGGPSDIPDYQIQAGVAIVERMDFRGKVYCTVYVHPDNMAAMLPESAATVTERDKQILGVFSGLISSARKSALFDLAAQTEELTSLVERGFLKCTKGQLPRRTGEKRVWVGYKKPGADYGSPMASPFDLAGARITPDGRNVC